MIEYLGKTVKVKIDRPLGSKHLSYKFIYPVNYGSIENELTCGGEEIEAYVLGVFEPISEYEGKVIGIIKRPIEAEYKLVVAKALNSYEKSQISVLTEFQERYFKSEIITYEYLKSSIRNTVKALIRKDKKLLVLEEEYNGIIYYHLPGGGIEFREYSDEALQREVREEIGAEIIDFKPFKTLSNIFEVEGMSAHEIVQFYEVELAINIEELEDNKMNGDLTESHFKLIDIDDFKDKKKVLYPEKLVEYL